MSTPQKTEFSKKIVVISGIVFTTTVMSCIGIFIYCTIMNLAFDWTGIVSLLTVTGGAFGTAFTAYEIKARAENIYKIKKSFLKEKYTVLKKLGVLDNSYAVQEIVNEVQSIDDKINIEEENTLSDTTSNYNFNL